MLYEWEREGRKLRGQPKSWKQNIHETMSNLDITTEDAQVRNVWKTKRTAKVMETEHT